MIVSLSAPVCVHFKPEYNFETKFMLPVVKVVVPRGLFFFLIAANVGFCTPLLEINTKTVNNTTIFSIF